jgi:hypothetical protein
MNEVNPKLVNVFKYIGFFLTGCTLIATLYGIFRGVYRIGEDMKEVKAHQIVLTSSMDTLAKSVQNFSVQMDAVGENTILIGNYVQGVWRAFDYHVKNSPEVTKEDYARMMDLLHRVQIVNIDTMQYRITVKKIEK